jgi:hypothetical protein
MARDDELHMAGSGSDAGDDRGERRADGAGFGEPAGIIDPALRREIDVASRDVRRGLAIRLAARSSVISVPGW